MSSTMRSPAAPRPSALGAVGAIVGVELRRVLRDRTGLFFIVALPFIVILLFGAGGAQDAAPSVGIAGEGLDDLAGALEAQGVTLDEYATADDLARAVRRGDLAGGVVAGQPATGATEVRWIGDPGSPRAPAVRLTIEAVVARLDAQLIARAVVADEFGVAPERLAGAAEEVDAAPLLDVRETSVGGGSALSFGVDESAQHNLVLFVFITSLTGGAALIESRRLGCTRRMLASPVTAATVLAGTAAARFTIALGQAVLVLVGAVVLFGVQWGDPLAVAVTIALFSLCGTGASMLFGAMLSSPQQAAAIAPPLGIGLGMLGGALWPLEIVPAPMQALGRAVPHAWAIEALGEIGSRGGGLADVVPALLVLAGFAVVLLLLATWRLGATLRDG